MIFIIIILTFLFTSFPVCAQELVHFQNNPVISNTSTHLNAVQPFVLKEGDLFTLWYADSTTSGYKISRMQSSNGIDWYDKKNIAVTNRKNASDPFIFFENGIYTLYFASSENGPISLWQSKSTDGISYIGGKEEEILKSQIPWEGGSLSCPAIIKDAGVYYLFYAGNGVSNWGIGLATSSDGQTWQKCPNNPFIAPGASAHAVEYNDVFYLYFQTTNGLEVQQTNLLNGCNTEWTNRHVINSTLRDPSPIQIENNLWVYGTIPFGTSLSIGLAANTVITPPSYPIVIIPGMFASWNKDAILHNTEVSVYSWKLNPAVTEYDALTKTLENKGRTNNSDYYLFAYDWRKPIEETTQNLNSFLTDKIWSSYPYEPIQIIGHSLGGIVARIYGDENQERPIKQIITVGSPHLGIVQAYKPLAGGEIDRENTLMWLAEKLILLLNKSTLQTDKETISQKLPVLFDIIPTFPFLKNENGEQVVSTVTNTLFSRYPANFSTIIPQFFIGGGGKQTISGYTLGTRTNFDTLFGNYVDGHPLSTQTDNGDGVVLEKSSLNQVSPILTQNHGEIVFSKESIKTILSQLNIQVQDTEIAQGKATAIFPAILAFIQSPAAMQISHNSVITSENNGMIHLQNTENGVYSLEVTGNTSGEYTVSIWLIGATDDKWAQFKKQTTNGKKDEYTIAFDTNSGGTVSEYIAPTILPTSTPKPTAQPTIKPTPTKKPLPTKTPIPTKKPTPTPIKIKKLQIKMQIANLIRMIIAVILSNGKKGR